MADLRIENPATTDEFAAMMAAAGVRLPLSVHDDDVGVLVDADGQDVVVVDVNGDRPDEQVSAIAAWIVVAVNTCGGFKAVHP